MIPGEWMLDGDCSQFDGDIFFPEKGASPTPAKMVCFGCPVLHECREWALTQDGLHGVWGGTSSRERVKIRRDRRRAWAA